MDSLPAVLGNPFIAKLKEELVTLEGEYRKLGQTFKPEYPRMQRLEQNIAEVRSQLRGEIARVVGTIDADYRAALRNEREIQTAMDEQRALSRKLGDQMVQYSLLRRDVDTSRELYTALLTRLKETQISSALLTSNIAIVDRAEVPLSPSKPRRGLTLLIATVIGLFGGIGLAFFFEYLDTNIKDAREVEAILGVPTIGLVPAQGSIGGRRARRRRQLAEANGDGDAPFALVAHTETESVLSEAFRNLRTSLLYSSPDHPPKTFMITSLQPEDGKTSLATNLAIALGQLGSGEVLLIDGDMRRPNLHELLEVPQAPGLSTFLTGQAELPAVLKPTKIPNLYVIPAGRIPLNPAELLASARLAQALELLRERFAHVVFDAPPLIGVSDAMILAPRLEGVILVLRHGRASRDAAQRALQLLGSVRARVLGVVLNDVDMSKAGSGYYGYYGYYGYGDGNGDRDATAAEPRRSPAPGDGPRRFRSSRPRAARCWCASSPGGGGSWSSGSRWPGPPGSGRRSWDRRWPITSRRGAPASPRSSRPSAGIPATRTCTSGSRGWSSGPSGAISTRPAATPRPRCSAARLTPGPGFSSRSWPTGRGSRRGRGRPSTPRSGSTSTTSRSAGRRRCSCSAGASASPPSSTSATSSRSTPRAATPRSSSPARSCRREPPRRVSCPRSPRRWPGSWRARSGAATWPSPRPRGSGERRSPRRSRTGSSAPTSGSC